MKYTILLLLSFQVGISVLAGKSMSNCVSEVKLKLSSIDEIVIQYFENAEAPTNSLPDTTVLIRQINTEELTRKSRKLNLTSSMLLEKEEKKSIQKEVQSITDALANDDKKNLTQIAISILNQRMESAIDTGTEIVIKKAREEAKPYDDAKLKKAIAQYQLSKLQLTKIRSEIG